MPSPDHRFERLARLARSAADDTTRDEIPPALGTRVLAQLQAESAESVSAWEWLPLRAVWLAAAAAAVCVLIGESRGPNPPADERRFAQSIVQDQLSP